jgi:hypothetical protein
MNAKFLRPIGQCQGSALVGQAEVSSLVAVLGYCRGPSAIRRRVRAVIVDAIKGVVARWARPHVGVEPLKRLPLGTHGDAPSAIVLEVGMLPICAARPHLAPRLVFGGVREAVCCHQGLGPIAAVAPTREDGSAPQVARVDRGRRAAVTAADPPRLPFAGSLRRERGNSEESVTLPGEIEVSCAHNRQYNPLWGAV